MSWLPNNYFAVCLLQVTLLEHGSLITRSVSMDLKDGVIMRLTCNTSVSFTYQSLVVKCASHYDQASLGKTNNVVFEQVRHKSGSTATEAG